MKKRIWSILLTLCMVLTLVPVSASAAGDAARPVGGVLPQSELETRIETRQASAEAGMELTADSAGQYTTIEGAAAALRAAMVRRESTVSFTYVSDTKPERATLAAIYETAVEHTGVPTEGDTLAWQVKGHSSTASISYDGLVYTSEMTFNIEKYYTDSAQEQALDAAVASVLSDFSGSTDAELIQEIYDYLGATVNYDHAAAAMEKNEITDYTAWSAYGALVKHQAVCQGYALAFYRLALELGIDARIITGIGYTSTGGGNHAWNVVRLDGKYYNIDATWGGNEWFLKGESDFPDHEADNDGMAALEGLDLAETQYVPVEIVASGVCGQNLTWTLDSTGELIIRGTGAMYDYGIDETDEWPLWGESSDYTVTSVILEPGVTRIGEWAFYSCYDLARVEIPDTVAAIGEYAFNRCWALTKVVIPDSVTSIGNYAFHFCRNLTDVTLGSGIKQLAWHIFERCLNLETISIPEGVTELGHAAFYACGNLRRIDLPSTLTKIDDMAFSITGLTDVYFNGSRSRWNRVDIKTHNDPLLDATFHFALVITAQPQDYTGAVNSTAKFTVAAEGEGLTYQWQYSDDGGKTWLASSLKTATYSAKLTADKDGRMVRCIVMDKDGKSVPSESAKMIVSGPAIASQPKDYTGAVNSTAKFTVTASGNGLTYQWQYSDDGGKTWLASSLKTATYSAKLTADKDGRMVRCVITDKNGGSVISGSAKMIVSGPVITCQPKDYTGAVNSTAKFTVSASGNGLTYQWQYSDDSGKTWLASSLKTATYSAKLTADKNGRMVRCVVTDKNGGSVISGSAKMIVSGPAITGQPKDYTGAVNSTAKFTVKASGSGLTYQWQYSDDGGKTWLASSLKTATYSAKFTADKNGRMVRCVVTDKNGISVISSAASMKLK